MKKYSFTLIGGRLRSLRGTQSQTDFAARIEVPFRTYQRYEAGESMPKESVLERIAEECGVAPEWILTGHGPGSGEVRDPGVHYSLKNDPVAERIRVLLSEMDDEGRSKMLEYAEFVLKRKVEGRDG